MKTETRRKSLRPPASRLLIAVLAMAVSLQAAPLLASGSVVINEIHYHPQGGSVFEFLELANTGSLDVDLSGWSFHKGLDYEFPAGVVLPAGGFVVICRFPEAVAERFGLPVEQLLGWGDSSLSNGGERLVLADASGLVADEVRYDDTLPWDPDADGLGPSLQRLCPGAGGNLPNNWAAEIGQSPTPLAPTAGGSCPPPPFPPPAVAINEIQYHPLNDQEQQEFVELLNTTDSPVNLLGYCFSQGIQFCFGESRLLEPGGFVVVCRDVDAAQAAYGLEADVLAGNFEGQLSNDGERITLLDPQGRLVDSVRYGDSGEWSVGADGLGYSLEKIVPDAVSDDPASWSDSGDVQVNLNEWQTVSITGQATSSKLYFYIKEEGEFLIDNISLVDTEQPGVNLVGNGAFDAGIEGWEPRGNHADSRWSREPGGEVYPEAALDLISTGRGSSSSSVRTETVTSLDRSPEKRYTLTFSYLHIAGGTSLVARLSISTPSRGIYFDMSGTRAVASPGEKNRDSRDALPPFVSNVGRSPQEPRSEDAVTITARVRGDATDVKLAANLSEGEAEFPMLDEGTNGDAVAGDGTFTAVLPPQPHNTPVTFRIEATSDAGKRIAPPATDPSEFYGYYVNDDQPDSPLPVYTMILPTTNPRSWIAALNCSTYKNCSFAYKGDLYYNVFIRRRGGSVCGDPRVIKKYMKIRFHKGHDFENQRKINFQSLYTDKSLIRERMAWDLFGEMTNPYCRHYYVRLHANGGYFGLYAILEHPDARFLARNGLNPNGNLYKATASREEANGTYEKKTNEDGDFSDLRTFLSTMHGTPRTGLVDFFHQNIDEDVVIDYQASQVLTNNRDYPHKNHYLFHDTERDKWMVITWDVDLTYGKRWDGNFGGVLHDKMDTPGISPWYTTNVRGEGLGNHLLDKFFFQAGTWYRRAYLVRLWDAIHEKYTTEFYEEKLLAFHDLLFDEQADDIARWGRSPATGDDRTAPAEFEPNLDRVRQHIAIRRNYLINYMKTREKFMGHDRLKITEIMYNPPGVDDLEFLELWNNSGGDIDISGWSITGLTRYEVEDAPVEFAFPDGTSVAADEVIVVAKNPVAFEDAYGPDAARRVFGPYSGQLSNEGETIRVKDAGPEYPATVDLVAYKPVVPWPREADGLGSSLELLDVEPDLDNDFARQWRASAVMGGSPGTILRPGQTVYFTRGECNGDGRINVSDGIAILLYLFRGAAEPPCLDACDTDGNLEVSLTDAVVLLTHIFLPDGPAIPSPAPGECLPAREGFCETGNCTP